jgi:ABC-2 type transport system permease protein
MTINEKLMNNFSAALFSEMLKMRRSKVPLFTALGFSMVPHMGGLFMIILKDPEAARSMGLISTKAQIAAGTAEWSSFFNLLTQAIAVGGFILFGIVTSWVFGREFSDHTVKELLALPTSRGTIVAAKFVVIILWAVITSLFVFAFGLLVGYWVNIPGWTMELLRTTFVNVLGSAVLTIALLPFVALLAGIGRGYLSPIGWMILMVALAQTASFMGWGDWFPWAVPALFASSQGEKIGLHSYVVVIVASLIGLAATFWWWHNADQTR